MYTYKNYFNVYGRIMQFNKNKTEPFHRWYPFVEGYSKEFIQSIIKEMRANNLTCLEPFSGSGTTALELQNSGIECYSFEVNPLMYLIARVKLEQNYSLDMVNEWFRFICEHRDDERNIELETEFKTLYQRDDIEKWNYNTEVAMDIQKLNYAIGLIDDNVYSDLFKVALSSILLDVSNLYRNGKCLSYKRNWKDRKYNDKEVFEKFDNKVLNELIPDIRDSRTKTLIDNKQRLFNLDSRSGIAEKIEDESIDLVITSPPYLNSRDYTDTYMLELKTMGFTKNSDDIRELREKTLRSHVQIKWTDNTTVINDELNEILKKLELAANKGETWNTSIVDMVRLYFVDMQNIFRILFKKLKKKGKIYFNVSNSAYFNILINTLEICASIAEDEGFKVIEIREARKLKTSPQQKEKIGNLLEGVIVLQK